MFSPFWLNRNRLESNLKANLESETKENFESQTEQNFDETIEVNDPSNIDYGFESFNGRSSDNDDQASPVKVKFYFIFSLR